MTSPDQVARLQNALPFWLSLAIVPVLGLAMWLGGAWYFLVPGMVMVLYPILDAMVGLDTHNNAPDTTERQLFWYRLVTMIWPPIQFVVLFGGLAYAVHADISGMESVLLMFSIGVITGAVGIVFAHELMHQSNRTERSLGDILMAMVLYSHFRTEHLLVHHSYVGTPRDAVTARYNEGYYRFLLRVLPQSLASAWRAERAMLARKGLPVWHRSNPFWRYLGLQGGVVLLAAAIGGWTGILFLALQAFVAVAYLELVNYVEHYGLTRKYLGDGTYEIVLPRHSWNAAHKATNWLLINLQRHSDHHFKPRRRFPLLQHHDATEAPQLPYGYPIMGVLALIPRAWRRRMNPRVRKWRAMYYPEITDWSDYKAARNPMPKGAS